MQIAADIYPLETPDTAQWRANLGFASADDVNMIDPSLDEPDGNGIVKIEDTERVQEMSVVKEIPYTRVLIQGPRSSPNCLSLRSTALPTLPRSKFFLAIS